MFRKVATYLTPATAQYSDTNKVAERDKKRQAVLEQLKTSFNLMEAHTTTLLDMEEMLEDRMEGNFPVINSKFTIEEIKERIREIEAEAENLKNDFLTLSKSYSESLVDHPDYIQLQEKYQRIAHYFKGENENVLVVQLKI
jgi:cell division protein FtsB